VSDTVADGGACRVCGRSALAHPSGACRSCRRGKGDTWIARKPPERVLAKPTLSEAERAPPEAKGWRERSKETWKRRSVPAH
jgi:hypothetical protein